MISGAKSTNVLLSRRRYWSLPLRTFCYPYGGFHSFTDTTERLLNDAGLPFRNER